MSKQNKSAKSVKMVKAKRGAPHKVIVLPKTARFTITDIMALNKVARLTVYNQINDGTLQIKATKETKETGGVGKPGTYFIRTALWEKNRQAAKTRKSKLATAPAIDLTPTPAPAADPAPVADTAVAVS